VADVIQLNPHTNMTVEECLEYCRLEQDDYQDVMVLSYNQDNELVVRSSHMSRKDALWMLMAAVDHARGIT
jgi:hypothetical protein